MNKLLVNSSNPAHEEMFREKWKQELTKLANQNQFPKLPSPGWLQNLAAKHELCTALFQHPDGSYAVCGRRLREFKSKDNPWFCSVCADLIKKITGEIENLQEKAENELPF